MNPDKLFDYLDGKLSATERVALEERLASDQQLQRELAVSAAPGKLEEVANEIISITQRLGGTAAKGIPEEHRLGILVDLPSNRETEFRAAISAMTGGSPSSPAPIETNAPLATKKSFSVQVIESALP